MTTTVQVMIKREDLMDLVDGEPVASVAGLCVQFEVWRGVNDAAYVVAPAFQMPDGNQPDEMGIHIVWDFSREGFDAALAIAADHGWRTLNA